MSRVSATASVRTVSQMPVGHCRRHTSSTHASTTNAIDSHPRAANSVGSTAAVRSTAQPARGRYRQARNTPPAIATSTGATRGPSHAAIRSARPRMKFTIGALATRRPPPPVVSPHTTPAVRAASSSPQRGTQEDVLVLTDRGIASPTSSPPTASQPGASPPTASQPGREGGLPADWCRAPALSIRESGLLSI